MTEPTQPERGHARSSLQLSIGRLWAFVAVVLPAVTALEARMNTIDAAYNIRAGEIMLRTYGLVRTDTFTFTAAGRPWLNQQWMAQVFLAIWYRAGGWAAIAVLRAALVGAIFLCVYLACRSAGAGLRRASWLTIACFLVSVGGLGPRPQLIGMALFALTVWLTVSRHAHPRRLWLVPLIVVAWVNVHGSFFMAPLLLFLIWLQDRHDRRPSSRRTLSVAVASLAATLVNPFGFAAWSYVFGLTTNPVVTRFIQEWEPPVVRDITGAGFFASALAVAAFLAVRGKKTPWPTLLLLGAFFAIGLFAVRGIFWWAIVAPPVVAGLLGVEPQRAREDERNVLNTAIAVVLVALGISFLPGLRERNPLARAGPLLSDAPSGVTANLRELLQPGERVFVPQRWGSWFELQLPQNPVSVDARIEVIPESAWRDYVTVSFAQEGWQDVLDRWRVDVVVASREQQRNLIPAISGDPDWRLEYSDSEGLVFVRT